MSAAAEAQETIRSTVERQISLGKMKIDAALARIRQSQADIAVDRETIERNEAMIVGWRRVLDLYEEKPT